jgi:WW domain-containing oxidoreductase
VIATNLSRSMGVMGYIYRVVGRLFLKSVPQGAATTVYAATAPELAGRHGLYLSDCAEKAPISAALDGDLADKLWDLSEKAIGTGVHETPNDQANCPRSHLPTATL